MNVNTYFLEGEDNDSSRHMQGKRRLANYDGCRYDLKEILPELFNVFRIALEKTNEALRHFKPEARSGNLEPNILQSCFAEELFSRFKLQASFGKYSRITLRAKGYIILFKKLSSTGKPMNIKTKNVQNISNQKQTLSLFTMENSDYQDEPILFFGYKKNRLSKIVDPQLVYLDEGLVRFAIHQSEIIIPLAKPNEENKPQLREENKPRIRKSN